MKYPSLYDVTNKRSASYQKRYFFFLRLEYCILILNAANAFLTYEKKYIVALVLFSMLMLMMVLKIKKTSEQEWYKYRAITESIKTVSWKFSMRAEPFNDEDEVKNINSLSEYLEDIVGGSEFISKTIDPKSVDESTVTDEMKGLRTLSFEQRRDFYVDGRINDQRDWYVSKAQANKDAGKKWNICMFVIYALAFLCSLYNAYYSVPGSIIPISILTTIASSLVGWIQVKRYSELSASYILTAHEIGVIKEQASYVSSESDFSSFIRDAETAFSREHTQWIARRVANRKPK